MEYSNFGQIDIYNNIFSDFDEKTIKGNVISCIENKKSYCGIYKNQEFPIMIGSKFDKSENPFKIKGFFVIDGICKSINSIKFDLKPKFRKDECYLLDNSKINIIDMFNYTITFKNKTDKWYLPINYIEIAKYSKHKEDLLKHFKLIEEVNSYKLNTAIKNEIDLINLCYMFECWLGYKQTKVLEHRLYTAGEILKTCINQKQNIIDSFKTNTWKLNYKTYNCISEDMKHYNLYSDLEAIRRITIMNNRDLAPKECRTVKKEERYRLCPVQTSDGSICGTVNYLCKDAKIITNTKNIDIPKGNEIHLYINNEYKGKTENNFIFKLKYEKFSLSIIDEVCYAFYNYGIIVPGKIDVSYTTSLIPNRYNNPPIRAMFASNMIKQAIMYDKRNIRDLLPMSKSLINNIDFEVLVGIMPWYGYNIEDGIVISESLAEKYKYTKTRVYNSIGKTIDVYVKKNNKILKGDILFKIFNPNEIRTVTSVYAEDDGIVKNIIQDLNKIKIIISEIKPLKVGDKLTSLHGQKGVISLVLKDSEMPYFKKENTNIHLELLINPHAFPSRMTMGQIIEMGNIEKYLYIKNQKIKNKIIVGKCKYLALRHQVDDKLQYRIDGNYDPISKQPIRGRKNNGGLRFGQMERDILFGLGAYNTLKELWSVDRSIIKVCPKTGIINDNNDCCKIDHEINQGFIICLSYLRGLGYDIRLKNNQYSICNLDTEILPKTDNFNFGDVDPGDVRYYKNDFIVLPICLRSNKLNDLYIKSYKYKANIKEIIKETKKLLKSKKGVFHKYIEGHITNKCIRSVISPNPDIDIDTVLVPIEANIGCKYGILNRQPSLNINSIKLVKIDIHNNKTISFNPLLCKSFNADFDGDEMNIYGIKKEDSINELKMLIDNTSQKTQDYILGNLKELTENGLTANKKGIKFMIENKSKGTDFNYDCIYNKISNEIKDCYINGISKNNYYNLCILAREDIISIALKTPITGNLLSLCIQRFI
uniref:DNA-directed RNA polymerase subunit beta n=1 Tax=Pichia etchellsii TaxID=28550 RepID=Q9HFH5_PICET|nr:putative RNA-polymerase [Schwanniomyces etchellsii]